MSRRISVGADGVAQRAGLGRGPAVEPDDGGRERLGVRVDGDEAIDLGGQPEDADVRGGDAGAFATPPTTEASARRQSSESCWAQPGCGYSTS